MDPKVLIVDDDDYILDAFRRIFRNRYQIACAKDGWEGLGLLDRDGPFAVVISDWKMPGIDGTQFLAEVMKRAPHAARIMLSGHKVEQLAQDAVESGYLFSFHAKPFELKAFHRSIEAGIEAYAGNLATQPGHPGELRP